MNQKFDNNLFLIIFGLVFIIAELLIGVQTGFDLALIGTAVLLGGVVGYIFSSILIGISTAIFLSLLYVFLGRKFIKDKLKFVGQKSNIDTLIDKKGIVTKEIGPHKKGNVKIGDEIWLAEADENLPVNTEINVINVEGVTLKVKKAKT